MNLEEHLRELLVEEASEVIKEAAKGQRFGPDDSDPNDKEHATNKEKLIAELNDLFAVVGMLSERGMLPEVWVSPLLMERKRLKVLSMIQYARQKHTINGELTTVAMLPGEEEWNTQCDCHALDGHKPHLKPGVLQQCNEDGVAYMGFRRDDRDTFITWNPEDGTVKTYGL